MGELRAEDRASLARRGIATAEVERQAALLRQPPPPARLVRAATPGDGIRQLRAQEHAPLLAHCEEAANRGRLLKMVPASGAASRMFRALTAVHAGEGEAADHAAVRQVTGRLEELAFHDRWLALGGQANDRGSVLEGLLDASGLDLARCPKGLIAFHRYPGHKPSSRTAFVEHLIEGTAYLRDAEGRCQFHFTVAADQEPAFRAELEAAQAVLDARGSRFEVRFSNQSPATDTVALDTATNQLFREDDGSLLFRPGGHGALLRNLHALAGDIVLIKNIDNVLPEDRQPQIGLWQRLLTGVLVHLQQESHEIQLHLDRDTGDRDAGDRPRHDEARLDEACAFLVKSLNVPQEAIPSAPSSRRALLEDRLDRPLRVCAMVRNDGEPGGGPFWVEDGDGNVGLQIVESAQIDRDDAAQRAILASSSHFNPVALICGVRDHRGRSFDLQRFVDPRSAFVTEKSHAGRQLRALEHPGLWNGAMARWNTVFVEVPSTTFAPVKTVLDLLRPEHQPPPAAE